jgi:hypothetical protein
MAKKKQSKKHKFKYSEPTNSLRGAVADAPQPSGSGAPHLAATLPGVRPTSQPANAGRDFSYVLVDLRKILLLGGSLILAEVALWFVFGHTGLGNTIYSLVNV